MNVSDIHIELDFKYAIYYIHKESPKKGVATFPLSLPGKTFFSLRKKKNGAARNPPTLSKNTEIWGGFA